MDHIRQFDWCESTPDNKYFVTEADLDNSATSRILRGEFRDPLLFSDSDSDDATAKVDIKALMERAKQNKAKEWCNPNRTFCPGLRAWPNYQKLSELKSGQHFQLLKVLASKIPPSSDLIACPAPTRLDHKVFLELQETYQKEQTQFIEWAKTLWAEGQCIRALKPKPIVEQVYEAEFLVRTTATSSLPTLYEMAAQIPMESKEKNLELALKNDLITFKQASLPELSVPLLNKKYVVITNKPPIPSICKKHPCRIILPGEKSVTEFPLTKVMDELSQYAIDKEAGFIVSEGALKCLVEQDRSWVLPIAVKQKCNAGLGASTVVAIGSEVLLRRATARTRTAFAMRHLLHYSLTRDSKHSLAPDEDAGVPNENVGPEKPVPTADCQYQPDAEELTATADDLSGSEDEDNLVIDWVSEDAVMKDSLGEDKITVQDLGIAKKNVIENQNPIVNSQNVTDESICMCKDTPFEKPPSRSYSKWEVGDHSNEKITFIVHCSHKVVKSYPNGVRREVLVEPVLEYQLDLGGVALSESRIKSSALSLYLHRNAVLLNVRLDPKLGDIVAFEWRELSDLDDTGGLVHEAANTIHTVLSQLQGLLPGHYVLKHNPEHGANSILFVSRPTAGCSGAETLHLSVDSEPLKSEEEARDLKVPPTLSSVLLPMHKMRKLLPLAFTPYNEHVSKAPPKKPPKKPFVPTKGRWPKKKIGKRKKKK